jgi:3-oxoadipate enol-lactonase
MNGAYQSDGAHLSYRDSGKGMPIVFLHPTPLDHDYWRPVLDDLAGSPATAPPMRAIVPDLRGHGASELGAVLPVGGFARVPAAPVLTMAQMAADTLVLLDKLEVREAVYVGCSIGGYVMLELWRRAPQRMRGLAFVCSKPQADAEPALVKRAANIALARESGVAKIFDGIVQLLLGETTRRNHPGIVSECRSRMTLTTEAFVAVQAGLAARPDSIATVASIDKPVLAIAGGEDTAVNPADMEAFRAAPGRCDFHLLPDAGHFAAYEQPGKVAALLSQWLRNRHP